MRKTIVFLLLVAAGHIAGQSEDYIAKVNNKPITLTEFRYIYEKNNREKADFSKESLEEYLNLYINFKLKVEKARELKYHERSSYQEELAGYRKQLADSYLIDKEVIEHLTEQAYIRKQSDVGLRHILIQVSPRASEADKAEALKKIRIVQEEIAAGMSFETAAREYSDDKNSAALGGNIGYITATLPDGYIALEDAAYTMNIGAISEPILTDMGYHLLKLVDVRPARGTVEAAHILIRKKLGGVNVPNVKERIMSIHKNIASGNQIFEDAVVQFSEDMQTKNTDGVLGFFGIGQYEPSFEDAAFGIKTDGHISEPVETSVGWHIIKRISHRPPADRVTIRQQIKGNDLSLRFQIQKQKVLQRIKQEAGYKEIPEAIAQLTEIVDDGIFEYDWQVQEIPDVKAVILDRTSYTLKDIIEYAKTLTRMRIRAKGQLSKEEMVDQILIAYGNDLALKYADSQLEARYPEFRNLMREYEEGILLFEVTSEFVWNQATIDTVGLKKFFEKNRDKYQWQRRAKLTSYSIRSLDPDLVTSVFKMARNSTPEEVKAAFNQETNVVLTETEIYEDGSEYLKGIEWKVDVTQAPIFNNALKVSTFKKIEEIYPPARKEFREAKGFIISDYQESLDKAWIQSLRSQYKTEINRKALRAITKN